MFTTNRVIFWDLLNAPPSQKNDTPCHDDVIDFDDVPDLIDSYGCPCTEDEQPPPSPPLPHEDQI
jgi:hypothetical protein